MIRSPYATKFTRMHITGMRNPEVDMTNRKASQRPMRKALWLSKQKKAADAHA